MMRLVSQSFILIRFVFFWEEELSKLNPKLEAGTYLLAPSNNNLSCFKSDTPALFLLLLFLHILMRPIVLMII